MKAIKQLDDVLLFLYDKADIKKSTTYDELEIKFERLNSLKKLFLIIDKLCSDGFVKQKSTYQGGIETKMKVFHITFDGIIFIEKGGYTKKYRRENIKTLFYIVNIGFILLAALCTILLYTKQYIELIKK